MNIRIGLGYDIHKLVPERKLFIGGVEIPSQIGEEGFSDGDVLIHAIIDAIFGALSLGDIGEHFPPGDERYKNVRSTKLLEKTREILLQENSMLINIDCTVILEKPKLSPYKNDIRKSISGLLKVETDAIGFKAKTREGLDSTGNLKAIEAYAAVLLERKDNSDIWL